VDVALLLKPPPDGRELLLGIADELGVPISQRDVSRHELAYQLTRRLLENHGHGRRTVVIIDEAQNICLDVLEQVRLLTNLETSTDKLLHVILVGQPELRDQLARPSLHQVSQHITAQYHLEPLSASETENYVHHRLAVAGCRQGLFSAGALQQLHRESHGIPRVINILCDRALLAAFANDLQQVNKEQIRLSAKEWRNKTMPAVKWQWWRRLGLPFFVLFLLGTAALLFSFDTGWRHDLWIYVTDAVSAPVENKIENAPPPLPPQQSRLGVVIPPSQPTLPIRGGGSPLLIFSNSHTSLPHIPDSLQQPSHTAGAKESPMHPWQWK